MIDLEKAFKEFEGYSNRYNMKNGKIALKKEHMLRVSKIAGELAKKLNLSKEDIELAKLIGLLHDIGRFEQAKVYNTFRDSQSINHGQYGVKILFEENLIRKFIDDNKYDSIIYTAILNHNTGYIDSKIEGKELLHTKIIRDADKIDIMYVVTESPLEDVYNNCKDMSDELLTPEIYNQFINDKHIKYKERKTNPDLVISHIAFIYDFNYKYSLSIIKREKYIEKLINRMNFKQPDTIEKFKKVKEIAYKYMSEEEEK